MYYMYGVIFVLLKIHWLSEPVPIVSNGQQYILHGQRNFNDQTILSTSRIWRRLKTVQKHGSFLNFEVYIMQNKITVYFIMNLGL